MNELSPKTLPSGKIMDIVGEYAGRLKNPSLKLRLINRVMESYAREFKAQYRLIPHFDEIIARRLITTELERLCPEEGRSDEKPEGEKRLGLYKGMLWHFYPYRLPVFSLFVVLTFVLTFWGVGTVASYIPAPDKNKTASIHSRAPIPQPEETGELKESIWLVEESPGLEIYSNRLRIITTETINNVPRRYLPFPADMRTLPEAKDLTDKISGILYHSSESDILPLSEKQNASIKKSSRLLLKYIKKIKSYHYFIDRYGRVYRVVAEDQAGFHAGNSIWSDDRAIYLNLNHAFLGICFEGRDFEPQANGLSAKTHTSITEVQVKSARELTDWLRYKYSIDEKNCVTHGLTSINPKKKLIGYHMDLAKGFPFQKMGLKDKYKVPLPSMALFGFRFDDYYLSVFKNHLNQGITLALRDIRTKAGKLDMAESEYRNFLNSRFIILNQWQWMIENQAAEAADNQNISDKKELPETAVDTRKRLAGEFRNLIQVQ